MNKLMIFLCLLHSYFTCLSHSGKELYFRFISKVLNCDLCLFSVTRHTIFVQIVWFSIQCIDQSAVLCYLYNVYDGQLTLWYMRLYRCYI